MYFNSFISLFLAINFFAHGAAFTILGFVRRKLYYFRLTATFTLLTLIYLIKFEAWDPQIPGTDFSAMWALRAGAMLFTASYLRVIYGEEGSWLWKLRGRLSHRS